ncbi:MAG: hypothetical protein LBQ66_00430 [Planctomycetaceae bacterium]|jgi:hypothetical protein|nr:hypothetical protein [Planctomycetaceae bacterium]
MQITIPIPDIRLPTMPTAKTVLTVLLSIAFGFVLGVYFTTATGTAKTTTDDIEANVKTMAAEYPDDLRDRWAWCYLDSVENWSTDQKLREDVRIKSTIVLSGNEREILQPLDSKIAAEIEASVKDEKNVLRDVYRKVGSGLRVHAWEPEPETVPAPPTDDDAAGNTDEKITPSVFPVPQKKENEKPTKRRRLFLKNDVNQLRQLQRMAV